MWKWGDGLMRKNYKLQNTKEVAPPTNYCIGCGKSHWEEEEKKGSYGLHQGTFKLQTITALIKSFCRGVQGGQFFQKAPPLAAGGIVIILFISALFMWGEVSDVNVDQLYLDVQFPELVRYFEKRDYQKLSMKEKLLFIESLARTARGPRAKEKLALLLTTHSTDPEVLAVAGAVYLSLGELDRAKTYIDKVLALKPGFEQAIISRILLLLYQRRFNEAKLLYEKLLKGGKEISGSEFVFLIGLDVFRACGEPQELNELYKTRAQKVKKINKSRYESLKANSRMHKRAGNNKLFQVETAGDNLVIPFAPAGSALRLNTISMTIKDKTFNVFLDTGNATGWLVHSRELNELLKPKAGGRTLTRIGSETGMLDANRYYYKTVDFNNFKIHHVNGIYVPRPRPDFPDANLNPSCIRDRVVTIDFVKKELILQTKEKFESYLSTLPGESFSRLRWYGYKFPTVMVEVKGKQGLAMIETGAQDIAFKLDFVQGLPLELIPKVKYLASGQVFKYHHAAVALNVGKFLFERQAAEVWPLNRFYNRISGVSPDVVIGPGALAGEFSVSFDPFDNQIIFLKQK
jgi:tetratricopeptide (TPR) repeat protein